MGNSIKHHIKLILCGSTNHIDNMYQITTNSKIIRFG